MAENTELKPAAGEAALEEEVRRHVVVTKWTDLISHIDAVTNWGRRSSLWPMSFGLACCAIEMICTAASRFDIARFGAELFRPSPRQADLMIVAGTVTKKMIPMIVRLYNQIAEPKYVMAMGACANGGGPFKEGYNVVSGVDEFLPVDVYIRGCPPTPQALLHGLMQLQKKIDKESYIGRWKRRSRVEVPVPLLGPDLVDVRQISDIREGLAKGEEQRLKAPKEPPARRPAPKLAEVSSLGESSAARATGAKLAERFGAGQVQAHAKDSLVIDRAVWGEAARALKSEFGFDYLTNVSSADYADCYEVVYHLCNTTQQGPAISVKVRADKESPEIPSATPVWQSADFQEREVYDMMGVKFGGHPNLKRLLMWEGFDGHPLRKDYLEPYYEEARKRYASRWREGRHVNAEDRDKWGRNVIYPAGMDLGALGAQPAVEDGMDETGRPRMLLSVGPQHPATHGVFQMKVVLEGERVVKVEPTIGYLHRCHEKIGERNTYLMNMPFTDRLDYITSMCNNLTYATAVERLAGLKVSERAEYIRVIMAELTRIINHYWAAAFLVQDLGAWFTPTLYMMEERELILDLFEMVAGSRMMCNYMRFSGVAAEPPAEFFEQVKQLATERLPRAMEAFDKYLTKNEIVRNRCQGIGVLSAEKAINCGVSGPVLRGSGVKYDVRKADPYSIYDRFNFDVVTFPNGDAYDRYRVRLGEMWQSLRIIEQALKQMPKSGPIVERSQHLIRPPEGEVYGRCENPKGELGFYLVSDGGMSPYRYHVRSPCLINLTALEEMCRGHLIADCIAVFGSIDIVLGEVDR